jgi:hypothetical protein
MKSKDLFLAITAIFLLGLLVNSCKNPGEGVVININTNVLKAPTAVRFVNAKKNAPNQPGTFPVAIGGKDAGLVVTASNKTTFTATDGRIFLALKKGVIPSESNPIIFTIAAEVPGFTPATYTFRITKDKPQVVDIPMVEYANPVIGTSAKVQDNLLVGGTATTAITIETPRAPGMTAQATISIAAGTEFLDAAGHVINAAKLETRMVNYGSDAPQSMNAFPGGFNATTVSGESGQTIPGGVALITAGFMAIDMYAGGTEVKSLSKPLTVKMGISKNLLNPEIGATVKVGDVWPVWSLNDKTGHWAYEAKCTVEADAAGDLSASFSATHLSYFAFNHILGFCQNELTVTFNAPNYLDEVYTLEIRNDHGYRYERNFILTDKLSSTFRAPVGIAKFIVRDANRNIVAETPAFDACAASSMTVNMPNAAALDIVDVAMKLKGVCPNKPVDANVTSWVNIYELSKGPAYANLTYVVNGIINLKVKNNTRYGVQLWYSDKWKTTEILFTKKNFAFSGTIKGIAVFVEGTNTLNVDAEFPLPDCS